jgi:hypothetical protein
MELILTLSMIGGLVAVALIALTLFGIAIGKIDV